jgi:hypothetical protein
MPSTLMRRYIESNSLFALTLSGRGPELERVLRDAADPKQRQVSAALLGYAKRSPSQVQGLADAILDSDPEVRNNAIRALMVLTSVKNTEPIHLNLTSIEALLSSGVWSDRNKASLLLDNRRRET